MKCPRCNYEIEAGESHDEVSGVRTHRPHRCLELLLTGEIKSRDEQLGQAAKELDDLNAVAGKMKAKKK